MAPTSLHTLIPRNDPSLGELFNHFPAKVWRLCKFILLGVCLMLAIYAIIIGICFIFASLAIYVPRIISLMKNGEWRRSVKGWREKAGRVGRIERLDRIWIWLKRRTTGGEAEVVDIEELEHLDNHDSEGREGSVSGETLFESEDDEDGDEQGRKKGGYGVE